MLAVVDNGIIVNAETNYLGIGFKVWHVRF